MRQEKIMFMESAVKTETQNCIEWPFERDKDGYGDYTYNATRRAHRVSWSLVNGEIPVGHNILHTCDNPSCINPHHLYAGTQQRNIQDSWDRKRRPEPTNLPENKGEAHGQAKLTEKEVIEIRAAKKSGATDKALSRAYRVGRSTITDIKNRVTWAHIP